MIRQLGYIITTPAAWIDNLSATFTLLAISAMSILFFAESLVEKLDGSCCRRVSLT